MQIHWRRSFCLLRPRPSFFRLVHPLVSRSYDETDRAAGTTRMRTRLNVRSHGVSFNSLPLLPLSGLRVGTKRTFAPTSLPIRSFTPVPTRASSPSLLSFSSINCKISERSFSILPTIVRDTTRYLGSALAYFIIQFTFRYSIVKISY